MQTSGTMLLPNIFRVELPGVVDAELMQVTVNGVVGAACGQACLPTVLLP